MDNAPDQQRKYMIVLITLAMMFLVAAGYFRLRTRPAKPTEESTEVTASEPEEQSATYATDDTTDGTDTTDDVSTEDASESTDAQDKSEAFYITPITDEIFERIEGNSYKENCTVPREDLRYLHVLHKDEDGNVHEGEMIVNRHIAEDVLEIFEELYDADYPIEKVCLVDAYNADDEASMEDNNSSAFNYRYIAGTTTVSKHGLGLAVDINPLYNPYVMKLATGEQAAQPVGSLEFADRDAVFPYKIAENDLCYQLFTEKGFEWGGTWSGCKDYQHFEIPDETIHEWYPIVSYE